MSALADLTKEVREPPPALDVLLACTVLLAGGLEAGYRAAFAGGYPVASLPLLLLLSVPLAWRRRRPLVVFSLALLASYFLRPHPIALLAAAAFAGHAVGAYAGYRRRVVRALAGTVAGIFIILGGELTLPGYLLPFLLLVVLWLVGNAIRVQRLRADASEERASRLEREREQAMRLAVAEERGRIARELHDVVAHSVSVMVVQAGAARHVLGTSPRRAEEALLAVEVTGREALDELRHLLGLLSEEEACASRAPQPGLDQLEGLIQRVRDAGLPVELRTAGEPCPLPPGLGLTAYRIIQEALTNALKYAGLAQTTVLVEYGDAEMCLEVVDDGARPAASSRDVGRGIVGMRERATLYGGRLEAGPRPGRGYAVRARLPLERRAC